MYMYAYMDVSCLLGYDVCLSMNSYVARVTVPGGRVHVPVPGTWVLIGYISGRTLPYPILGPRTQDSVIKKGVLIGEMVHCTPCLGTSYPMFWYSEVRPTQ